MQASRITLASMLALASASVAFPASAQDVGAEESAAGGEGNQIVVTALRRDESLQDTPAAITAFNSAAIENAGIERPGDFIALTSNVNLVETQNAGNAFIIIRGITQARNSEPSVAIVVDGVQQVNPAQFNQDLFDIQQIEVLKGPQGALYGRNAIGGAISIVTQAPSDEFEAKLEWMRGFVRDEASWDLLALVVLGGAVATLYQGSRRVLSRRWVLLSLAAVVIAAVLGVVFRVMAVAADAARAAGRG